MDRDIVAVMLLPIVWPPKIECQPHLREGYGILSDSALTMQSKDQKEGNQTMLRMGLGPARQT